LTPLSSHPAVRDRMMVRSDPSLRAISWACFRSMRRNAAPL